MANSNDDRFIEDVTALGATAGLLAGEAIRTTTEEIVKDVAWSAAIEASILGLGFTAPPVFGVLGAVFTYRMARKAVRKWQKVVA